MNLDQVTLEIRPRSAWEALDLGLLMARRWWAPMMKAWLIVSFPILIIALLIPTEKWWISALLLWWLKPIYERPLLHIISHAVFNDLPGTSDTLKQFPSQAAIQLFLSLTWRRFSPTRSMDLPVLQLEGLNGTRRQERLSILHREDSTPAGWITVLGLVLEMCLWFGFIIVLWVFIPREFNIEWAGLFFDGEQAELIELKIIFWYCALALSAPFYVACGFALYLNRRITLEAWDLDLAFRRIVNKRSNAHAGTLTSILGALLFGVCVFLVDAPNAVLADEQRLPTDFQERVSGEKFIDQPLGEYQELNRDSAQAAIKEVMQQSEFSRKEVRRNIKWEENEEFDSEFWEKFFDSLRDFKGFIAAANLLEVLLWLAFLALIAFVIYRYRHWLAAQFVRIKPPAAVREKPVTLFGMDVTHESLPQDISQSAVTLLQAGDVRPALALLYRASLFQLIQHGVDIHEGHTESECVQLMREHPSVTVSAKDAFSATQMQHFAQLTRVWQQLAYGHIQPDHALVHQLCNEWNSCWLAGSKTQGGTK